MSQEEVPYIEEILNTKPVTPMERWAAAMAHAAMPLGQVFTQVPLIQGLVNFYRGESRAVQRNIEATRKDH